MQFSGEPVVFRRRRVQRALERFNRLPLPFVVLFFRAREGRLWRWELEVRTPAKPWSGKRHALSLWRWVPECEQFGLAEYRRRRGHRALPFQHPRRVRA